MEPVVVCIAGMHRSGTSMITRLLNLCGVYLGPDEDLQESDATNPAGHWEHWGFQALNEALLAAMDGAWDAPPASDDWRAARDLDTLRARGSALVARFDGRPCWGWKDPRNSLTLPFWKRLLPGLKVVVCVRNPLEVRASLRRRGNAVADAGVALWLTYHARLLGALGADDWLVTHHDAYLHDPAAELRRVVAWLGLDVGPSTIRSAIDSVRRELHHEHATTAEVRDTIDEPAVLDCYLELCADAGPVLRAAHAAEPGSVRPGRFAADVLRRRIVTLEERMGEGEQALAAISARAARLEDRLHTLDAAAAASAARAQELDAALATVTASRGWRVLEGFRRARLALVPNASWRERAWFGVTDLLLGGSGRRSGTRLPPPLSQPIDRET